MISWKASNGRAPEIIRPLMKYAGVPLTPSPGPRLHGFAYDRVVPIGRQTGRERGRLQLQGRGPGAEVGILHGAAGRHQAPVVVPELALLARAARRPRRGERLRVAVEGEVPVHELDLARIAAHDGVDRGLGAVAERALVVGELHDRDRRVVRTEDGSGGRDRHVRPRGLEGHLDLRARPQPALQIGAAFRPGSLLEDLADLVDHLDLRLACETGLVLLVQLLHELRVGVLQLLLDLVPEQALRRDPPRSRLLFEEAFSDHLLERLAADLVLLLAQARQPLLHPLVQLLAQDGLAVDRGHHVRRRGACRRLRALRAATAGRDEQDPENGAGEGVAGHSIRLMRAGRGRQPTFDAANRSRT